MTCMKYTAFLQKSSAAPQIYFDPEDKFRRAHGIAAG